MLRKVLAVTALLGLGLSSVGCGTPGEKESSKAPVPDGTSPASSTTPDKAAAGTPGELPPPPGFKKK